MVRMAEGWGDVSVVYRRNVITKELCCLQWGAGC